MLPLLFEPGLGGVRGILSRSPSEGLGGRSLRLNGRVRAAEVVAPFLCCLHRPEGNIPGGCEALILRGEALTLNKY